MPISRDELVDLLISQWRLVSVRKKARSPMDVNLLDEYFLSHRSHHQISVNDQNISSMITKANLLA